MTLEEARHITNDSGIYYFKNKINGKYYIGQAFKLKKRLIHHLSNYNNNRYNTPLYKAIEKYGLDNFEFNILQLCNNPNYAERQKELDRLEIKYIEEYNSYGSTGYNQTKGGDGGILGYKMTEEQKEKIRQAAIIQNKKIQKSVFCRNIKQSKYYITSGSKEASEISNINNKTIRNICCKKDYIHSGNWIFAYTEDELWRKTTICLIQISNRTFNYNAGRFVKGDVRFKLLKGFSTKNRKARKISQEQRDKISASLKLYYKNKKNKNESR